MHSQHGGVIDMEDNVTYGSKIYAMQFYVMSEDEIIADSNVLVRNKEIMKGDKPAMEGLYDGRMGTTDISWNCHTCGNSKLYCPGHFGSIELKYPVKSPLFRDEMLKWLKVVCHSCGRLVVQNKVMLPPDRRLSELVKQVKQVKQCPYCKEPHFQVAKDKSKSFLFWRFLDDKDPSSKKEFYNHQINEVLQKIADEDVILMGKPLRSHPKKFILKTICAPPNTIRPDIKRVGGSRSSNSDTTSLLKTIFEINELLPETIPSEDQITPPIRDAYSNLDMAYYTMIKGDGGGEVKLITNASKPPSSIMSRIPKKQGRIRRNLMGKRTEYMIRSVITGDSKLRINEVGIPMMHARDLEIPEKVTSSNLQRLLKYFNNGTKVYPGCKHIVKASDGGTYRRELLDPNYTLQIGDIVMRDMIDGDYICFNRQPSLLFSNIAGMRVVVMPMGNTLRINPSICNYFNADFDGDQMHAIAYQNIMARVEAMTVSRVSRWLISPQNHAPLVGAFQDGLIGIFELTKDGLNFNRWHAMQLFANIYSNERTPIDLNFPQKAYSNREIVSKLLPKINYTGKSPSFYKQQYAPFIKYNPADIKINIQRGQLLSGVIDNAIAGQGVAGSIIHIIANEYGNDTALDTVYNMQQMVHKFFEYHGFTVGIADINISKPTMIEVKRRLATMITSARTITQRLNSGKLIAPLGVSLKEYYESEQLNALSAADDFANPILADININNNQMARLTMSGSKGKMTNLVAINGAIGVQTINGKRFGYHAGWGRTSPYFVRYDTDPEANGFVPQSFREGVDNSVYAFMAGEARHGLISNALSTSITGYQNRIAIKNLESTIVDNLRKTAKNMNVIQPLCYESGLDPSKLENIKFPTIMISDKAFEENYQASQEYIKKQSSETARLLSEQNKQIKEDRDKYRRIHLELEAHNPKEYILDASKQMPVNVPRIIEDVLYNYRDVESKASGLDPKYAIERINELCDNLGYVFYNDLQRKLKRKLPKYIVTSTQLLAILIRSYLCIPQLLKRQINDMHLDLILQKIILAFKKALIDPGTSVGIIAAQCVCEKFTQYVLNSKHRTGGQGGTQTNAIIRMQEILGAKDTMTMKNPHMLICVKPDFEKDKLRVQEIANHIEMMSFERFISSTRVFFEKYGKPAHPKFQHEAKDIANFEKHNFGLKIPGDLASWCIRFGLSREEMILKSMKLETIVSSLRRAHPEVFIMHTSENANDVYLRVYLRNTLFKQTSNYFYDAVMFTIDNLKKVIVRGIKDIVSATVVDVMRHKIIEDGSLEVEKVYAIYTTGSNMADIMALSSVDQYRTQSDSIEEIEKVFGLVAARQKIINEMITTMSNLNPMHCTIFADEMINSGVVSNIQRTGLQKRENSNVTLRLSFQTAIQVIQSAAIHGLVDNISGISGPLVMGTNPSIGTTYNAVVVDDEFIQAQAGKLEDIVADL